MTDKPKTIILCPYCGHAQHDPADRCTACGGFFDPLSRKVSQQHMGPWFIRDSKMPFRPGCSYDVIVKQVERGRIKPTTIMRGPTTRQYWSIARNVPGVAHLLGYCHECGHRVDPKDAQCPKCRQPFNRPRYRDELGLDPYDPSVFAEAARAQAAMAAAAGALSAGDRGGTTVTPIGAPNEATMPTGLASSILSSIRDNDRDTDERKTTTTALSAAAAAAAPAGQVTITSGLGPPRHHDAMSWMETDESEPDDIDSVQSAGHGAVGMSAAAIAPVAAVARSSNAWVWALIAVNAVLAVVVVAIIMMRGDGGHFDAGQAPPLPPMIADSRPLVPSTPQPAVTPEPSPQPAPMPADQSTPPAPGDVTPPAAQPAPVQPQVQPQPTPLNPGGTKPKKPNTFFGIPFDSDDEPPADQPAPPPVVPPADKPAPNPSDTTKWVVEIDKALASEQAGELQKALDTLLAVRGSAPADQQPPQLDQIIARVKAKIERKQLKDFFEG